MPNTEDISKIKSLARNFSLLTQKEEDDFIEMLSQTSTKYVQQMAIMFEEDPRWVVRIYQSYLIKKQTILYCEERKWDEVIEGEIRDLEEYTFRD